MKGELDPQTHLEAKTAKWPSMSASAKSNRNLEQFKYIYPRFWSRGTVKDWKKRLPSKKKFEI